jgi:hypothetical protein
MVVSFAEEAAMGATTNSLAARPGHAIDQRATTIVQLSSLEFSGISSTEAPATVIPQFRPLDPGIVSETIPAFFIGRNIEGFWVARDARGQIGGIFLLKGSAVSFARKNSPPTGCATIFPSEKIELDLENRGNPLVAQLGWVKRLAKLCRQRVLALSGNVTQRRSD